MSNRITFTVHGKVQGVCFRWVLWTTSTEEISDCALCRDFAQKKANSYGITGFVKNTPDGKVVSCATSIRPLC